jgi:myb proto-oncogene protein
MKEKFFIIQKVKKQVTWTSEEDQKLISLVKSETSWSKISNKFTDKTQYDCNLRYRSINPSLKKGFWDEEEDKKLLKAVKVNGKRWEKIANGFSGRNAKQIRDRYVNYLDPGMKKEKFTNDEDMLIYQLHKQFGSKWRKYCKYFEGRSADMIKNRYNSSICKNENFIKIYMCLESTKVVSFILFAFLKYFFNFLYF